MTKVTRLTLDEDGALERRRIHLREISDDVDAPLDTVGQDLRTARLRRGDDLATVSRVLKIRKDHLDALEEDRPDALPGRTYAVGFIRSYADYLGLDAVQCVERYKAEIAGRSDPAMTPITVIDEDADRRMPHGWKIMAFIVLVLAVYAAYQFAVSADRMVNDKPVEPVPTLTKRPVAHKPPIKQVATVAVMPAAPDATAATAVPPEAAPLPQGQVYGSSNKNARVVLHLTDAARILVLGPPESDGRSAVFINRTLNPGDSYRVPNFTGVTLTTSNAGAVQVELDGAVIGTAGRAQETAEAISLDPQSIMDRKNGNPGR